MKSGLVRYNVLWRQVRESLNLEKASLFLTTPAARVYIGSGQIFETHVVHVCGVQIKHVLVCADMSSACVQLVVYVECARWGVWSKVLKFNGCSIFVLFSD